MVSTSGISRVINAITLDASASNRNEAPPNNTSFSSDGTLTPDSQYSELVRMADAQSVISAGALQQINLEQHPEPITLQCVQIKPMASQQGQERYRVVMNDSLNFIQCMLGTRESDSCAQVK